MSTTRPILFKGEMVRAILEGRKTQTRRLLKPQPADDYSSLIGPEMYHPAITGKNGELTPGPEVYGVFSDDGEFGQVCPFGKPGDHLWVRETHAIVPRTAYARSEGVHQVLRPDDNHDAAIFREGFDRSTGGIRWRPSIHMPRWASRITLEITDVRVERLQDISAEDAKAEGAQHFPDLPGRSPYGQDGRWSMEQPASVDQCLSSPRWAFANYFCKIAGNAPKGLHDPRPWDANPWVWVIEFKRIEKEGEQ